MVEEIPTISVGMLGYAFMGKAHAHALRSMAYMTWPPPAYPRLAAICGRNQQAVAEAARRYGFARYSTDWRDIVADPTIQVFDNAGPNDVHAEPCIAAAERGKHILCEKPLGRNAKEARMMLEAVTAAGVKHMVAFNYRFVPALSLARDLIQAGRLGEIRHFRGCYLQDWLANPDFAMTWRLEAETAGSGALGDLASHTIDLARWLVGEIETVSGLTKTFIPSRPESERSGTLRDVTVDDTAIALLEFEGGATGTVEATRLATGRKNFHTIEINGSRGSIYFNMERLNELQLYTADDPPDVRGFHNVLVTEQDHPYMKFWWPPGHIIGWEHTFTHELYHFLGAIARDEDVGPIGATFEDGYRNAVVLDAILESAQAGRRMDVSY